jgi:glycosyltransferase involved in cell wall biosynthesis
VATRDMGGFVNVGLLGCGLTGWQGGIDFLRLVANAFTAVSTTRRLRVTLIIPEFASRSPVAEVKRLIRVPERVKRLIRRVRRVPETPPIAMTEVLRALNDIFYEQDANITVAHVDDWDQLPRVCCEAGVDVLIPVGRSLGKDFPVPWVGWVGDFQHKYLSNLFSDHERHERDAAHHNLLTATPAVIVNSEFTAADIRRFHPEAKANVFLMPFAPAARPEWLEDKPSLLRRYRAKGRYFMICNQFWIHKNHAVAFKAFEAISTDYPDVDLICTGAASDYRSQTHFSELQWFLKQRGLASRVRCLGVIPKRHQVELVKGATALIQPSLFEGGPGGLSVYDAVALDTLVLASNIQVNREIRSDDVLFFDPHDPSSLAARMRDCLLKGPRLRQQDASTLLSRSLRKRRECGDALVAALKCAREHYLVRS